MLISVRFTGDEIIAFFNQRWRFLSLGGNAGPAES